MTILCQPGRHYENIGLMAFVIGGYPAGWLRITRNALQLLSPTVSLRLAPSDIPYVHTGGHFSCAVPYQPWLVCTKRGRGFTWDPFHG